MAGTDKTQDPVLGGPSIVLVEPQLGENIGTAARAMLNFGLTDLRLVRPRDVWPNPKALGAASGADAVVNGARLFDTTEEAIADLQRVYAASARTRDMRKTVVTPQKAAADMRAFTAAGESCGILFGPERAGLNNDDVALADTLLSVPLNPAFPSLNIAQAVLLIAYEWFRTDDETPPEVFVEGRTGPAARADLIGLFEHLESELVAGGFLFPPEKAPVMMRNLRNMLQRAHLTDQEVRTFRGVIKGLTERRDR